MSQTVLNADEVLSGLKDFQRRTALYVFRRLYLDADCTRRFLIADEVGLGKTLVARGVIAKTIEHLRPTTKRIDIVYICSNADIARQNIQRLNLTGREDCALASRITLLPIQVKHLSKNDLNFISFTPGTSFEQNAGGGRITERVVLYRLLEEAWDFGGRAAPFNVLKDGAGVESFRRELHRYPLGSIDPQISNSFRRALARESEKTTAAGGQDFRTRFDSLCQHFCRSDVFGSPEMRRERTRLIGEMRRLLATVCLEALQPDLIILDEFQRFKELLTRNTPAGELANDLFDYSDGATGARVLLLSATPYKMLSLHHEAAEDDHYEDFLTTLKFFEDGAVEAFSALLHSYRGALFQVGTEPGIECLRVAKEELQSRLRKFMVRTERLATSTTRNGMLGEHSANLGTPTSEELLGYIGLQRIANQLGQGDITEYWKSAPYLLNFMDAYELKNALHGHAEDYETARALLKLTREFPESFLPTDKIRGYKAVEPGNLRLRGLMADTVDKGAWKMLWVPPSLPYYQLDGPFADPAVQGYTKRLVFTAWHVAPKAIASLVSYEAERQMIRSADRSAINSAEARKRRRSLLRFAFSENRLTGMPNFCLIYPSLTLAKECDPLHFPPRSPDGTLHRAMDVLSAVETRIEELLADISVDIDPEASGEAWYWAAPMLLDFIRFPTESQEWWDRKDLASLWAGQEASTTDDDDPDRWSDHVVEAKTWVEEILAGTRKLGPRPADLASILGLSAIASPANTMSRALQRSAQAAENPISGADVRDSAAIAGRAFFSLFNIPESREMIRGLESNSEEPFWRQVLRYCHSGCLQATLDEFSHYLFELHHRPGQPAQETAAKVAHDIVQAISLRTASLGVDEVSAPAYARQLDIRPMPMRIRFAMRFGEEKDEGGGEATRADRVRAAFNSPFWPFVLVTTSVGQEGLDFHPYCHSVVHWNLPSNPVDLEQREGRVHRYKGHAVRKNLSAAFGKAALRSGDGDPWRNMFDSARANRMPEESDLTPYWLFPGEAKIERHVPSFPYSREIDLMNDLRKSLTIYRMVFGQNRQEDLLEFILKHTSPEDREKMMSDMHIDLSPAE